MKQEKKLVAKTKKTVILSYWECNPQDKMDGNIKVWDSRGWSATVWRKPKSKVVRWYKDFMKQIGNSVPKRVRLEIE
jgi:hypothetical protein